MTEEQELQMTDTELEAVKFVNLNTLVASLQNVEVCCARLLGFKGVSTRKVNGAVRNKLLDVERHTRKLNDLLTKQFTADVFDITNNFSTQLQTVATVFCYMTSDQRQAAVTSIVNGLRSKDEPAPVKSVKKARKKAPVNNLASQTEVDALNKALASQ